MRRKPTLIAAGLTAVLGGTLVGTGSASAATSAVATRAPGSATVDCAAIASSFGSAVPESITTFYDAVNASNSQVATADAPLTLFIPANSAFDKIPANVLDSIVADVDLLSTILDYHLILDEALTIADLAAAGTEPTAEGDTLTFAMSADVLTINGGQATTVCPDIAAEGAIIHVIDGVLQPPSLSAAASGCAPGSSSPSSSTPSTATAGSSVPCNSTPSTSTP
jgi:uncharacterized surface protein with fasciclin (FAS1) repeats